jgi:hypothetical protein
MNLRAFLTEAAHPDGDRAPLYGELFQCQVYVRVPDLSRWTLERPDDGVRALAAFLSAAEATDFWQRVAPGQVVQVAPIAFVKLAAEAARTGSLVLDPGGVGLVLSKGELSLLAVGEIPGELAQWLRQPERLGRTAGEVLSRVRRAHLFTLVGQAPGGEQRLYLLEKSEDATLAVPCFSSLDALAQFASVRRLFEGEQVYATALLPGERCVRTASGLGAYLLIDPESPWEEQLEPGLP